MADRDIRLRILIEAVNRASNQLQKTSESLLKVKGAEEKVNAETADLGSKGATALDKFVSKLKSAEQGFQKMAQAGERAAAAGRSIALAGAAIGAAAFFPIKSAATFEKSMSRVKAVTKGTEQDFADMGKIAKELGRTTQFTASQAADGMRYLGQAGLDAKEAMTAIGPALDLAAAGELSLAEAADFATNIMSAFGKEATDISHISDVLAYAAANSNTSVRQLAEGMSYVAPIAKAAGISLELTAGFMGKLGDAGIQTSRAGTAMRGIIASLVSPSEQAKKALQDLHVTVEMNEKGEVNLAKAFMDLHAAGLTAAQAFEIFRRTGAAGATAATAMIEDIAKFTGELGKADGAARKMRVTIEDNLGGAWIKLTSAIDGFMTAAGEPLLSSLKELTLGIASLITKMTEWTTAHPALSAVVIATTGAIGGLLAAIGTLLIALGSLVKILGIAGVGLAQMAGAITFLRNGIISLTATLRAAALASTAFTTALGIVVIAAAVTEVWRAVEAYRAWRQAVAEANATIQEGIVHTGKLTEKFAQFKDVAKKGIIPENLAELSKPQFDDLYKQIRGMRAYWTATHSQLSQKALETTFFGNATKEAKEAQEEIKRIMPYYKEAIDLDKRFAEENKRRRTETLQALDKEYVDRWRLHSQKKELTEEEIKQQDKLLDAIQDIRKQEIEAMTEGLDKIEAARELELEIFERSNAAKLLSAEQTQRAINAINAQYDKERVDYSEKITKKAEQEKVKAAREEEKRQKKLAEEQKLKADNELSLTQKTEDLKLQLRSHDASTMQEKFDVELDMFDTQLQRELKSLEDQKVDQDLIDEFYANKQKERRQKIADYEKSVRDKIFGGTVKTLGDLSTAFADMYEASGKQTKSFFALYKAAAVAQTLMTTYQGAQDAFTSMAKIPYVGYALGVAAAAAAVASGLARVAMIRNQTLASGGEVEGHSSSDRADNIPIWATAKEWVMPVSSVRKYGKNVMEGIRKGVFPPAIFDGYKVPIPVSAGSYRNSYASGGEVTLARNRSINATSNNLQERINVTNIVDPAMVESQITSKPGQRTYLNVLRENVFEAREILEGRA